MAHHRRRCLAPSVLALTAALLLPLPGAAVADVRFQSAEDLYQTTSEPVAIAVGDVNSDWLPDVQWTRSQ